jgi:hypothetical protein
VADRSFASAENRGYLQRAGGHYILGERLRSGSAEAAVALSRPGRYRTVANNLQVKQVQPPHDVATCDRFVVCFDPKAVERDQQVRKRLVTSLGELIADTDRLSATKRAELCGQLSTKPGLHRYLKVIPGGLLRLDGKAIAAEAKLDGKFLLRSSRPCPVGRGHRAELRAADRRRARLAVHVAAPRPAADLSPPRGPHPRPRAAVPAGAAAHPLVETTTGRTWPNLRDELQRLHVGPSPARPAPSARAPNSPATRRPSSPRSSCPTRPACSPPPRPDQRLLFA